MTQTMVHAALEVRPVQKEVRAGGEATVELVLRNVGTRPLWVNGRLLVNTPHAPRPHREIVLSVVDPRGVPLDFECKVRAGEASAGDYRALEPGQSLGAQVRLNECFQLQWDGIYRISATYEDGSEHVPPPPADAVALRGPVRSSETSLRVIDGERTP